jgi:hypothetical protein
MHFSCNELRTSKARHGSRELAPRSNHFHRSQPFAPITHRLLRLRSGTMTFACVFPCSREDSLYVRIHYQAKIAIGASDRPATSRAKGQGLQTCSTSIISFAGLKTGVNADGHKRRYCRMPVAAPREIEARASEPDLRGKNAFHRFE